MSKNPWITFTSILILLISIWAVYRCGNNTSRFTGPTAREDPLPAALITDLERYVQKVMDRNNVPRLAMVLVHGDQAAHNQGFGVRDLQTKEPVDTGTLFGFGSSTRPMTAVMVTSLVDE